MILVSGHLGMGNGERKNFNNVEKIFKNLEGETYSNNDIKKILNEIDKIALQKEYQFINAEISEAIVDNKIDFNINISESEKSYIERINILGNTRTKDRVIRRELLLNEGDPFIPSQLEKSQNKFLSMD